MGSFDGAEICELVGLFLLNIINSRITGNFGLYRDDGLASIRATPRQTESIKKQLCEIFRENGLKITIECNKKIVNYLDVTLNLNNGEYQPYVKPNNVIRYVHRNSNHPPLILDNIPPSINNRLSKISSNESIFKSNISGHQHALKESGFDYKLTYKTEDLNHAQANNRGRKIIWYNPPFCKSVHTNVGKKFLCIIKEEFPKEHPLSKIFNKNNLKISYSCMPNIQAIIKGHNNNILKKYENKDNISTSNKKYCNCRNRDDCPLTGDCQNKGLIYQATVTSADNDNIKETYVGLTENSFKTRYYNHKTSFNNKNKQGATELSKFIWKLKEKNINFNIKWRILKHVSACLNGDLKCKLCISEKFYIIYKPYMASLNTRKEFINTCRHSSKYLLINTK